MVNQDDLMALALIAGGLYAWKTGLLDQLLGMLNIGSIGGGGGSGSGIGGNVAGHMIYKGTGQVIDGSHFVKDEQRCWKMQSGGCHPSSRFEVGGTGKSSHFCVPYHNLEATIYVKIGAPIPCQGKGGSGCSYIELGTGGPGQSDGNCCCYHLGFRGDGSLWGEEEGIHDPKVVSGKLSMTGGTISGIGSIYNRIIGLKTILWHDSGGVQLEGWVDAKNNGQWQRFYKATNPAAGGLPVITHWPMSGKSNPNCQEVRLRLDGSWPNDFIPSMTSVRELVVPVQPAGAGGSNISTTPEVTPTTATTPTPTTKAKSKSKTKSAYTKTKIVIPSIQYSIHNYKHMYAYEDLI